MIDRNEVIEIQRRFKEEVEIVINKGKKGERVEIVTDLPEPLFSEWTFNMSKKGPSSEILIRRCYYGASRSTKKPKLPASEKWSIFCNCSDNDPTGCDHLKSFVQGDLLNIDGWNQLLDEYYLVVKKTGNVDISDFILQHSISIPSELIMLFKKRLSSKTNEEKKDTLASIKNYGFPSTKSFINWLTFIALNQAINTNSNLNINLNEIAKSLNSKKLQHFLDIKKIIDIRIKQDHRFSRLSNQIKNASLNGRRVSFSNIGNDYCLYYSEGRIKEELNG